MRVLPQTPDQGEGLAPVTAAPERLRFGAGPHHVVVMHVRRDLPDALDRGTAVLGKADRALRRLIPGLAEVIAAHDGRAPVLRTKPDEQPRLPATGVDGDAGDLAHEVVRPVLRPPGAVVATGQPEPLASADGDQSLGHDSILQRTSDRRKCSAGVHHVSQRPLTDNGTQLIT